MKTIAAAVAILSIFLFAQCKPDENLVVSNAIIATIEVTEITEGSAKSGGVITDDGGSEITERGVCWSTIPNPTISDSKTIDAAGTGRYVSAVTGLNTSTTYYLRAYCKSAKGLKYGLQETFTTTSIPTTITDLDGNLYTTVRIGNQLWTVENWKSTKYNDGSAITYIENNTAWQSNSTGAYCVYNNTASNKNIYGLLYNWYAVNTGKMAPMGWRVPCDADWKVLENYLIANGYNYDGTTTGNKIAKSMADVNNPNAQWYSTTGTGDVGNKTNNPSYNNKSGFSALAGGCRGINGTFYNLTINGLWWSSPAYDLSNAMNSFLNCNNTNLYSSNNYKSYGFSIRLVRDL